MNKSKYFNYGSYLNSRGYQKSVGTLMDNIKNNTLKSDNVKIDNTEKKYTISDLSFVADKAIITDLTATTMDVNTLNVGNKRIATTDDDKNLIIGNTTIVLDDLAITLKEDHKNDVTIHNQLDVSGLDVSNNAKIKKLIIDASDVSYSLLEIHASGSGGNYAGITFHHDDNNNGVGSEDFYANKIQSSWPTTSNNWGKQRLEFITRTGDNNNTENDNTDRKKPVFIDASGLHVYDNLYLHYDNSYIRINIADLIKNIAINAIVDISGTMLKDYS